MDALEALRITMEERRQAYYMAYEAYAAVEGIYEAIKDQYTAVNAHMLTARRDYQTAKAAFDHVAQAEGS